MTVTKSGSFAGNANGPVGGTKAPHGTAYKTGDRISNGAEAPSKEGKSVIRSVGPNYMWGDPNDDVV